VKVIRIVAILVLTLILGCSSHEELPPPDNPFDPGNPDYVFPEAEIISGPTEGEIIESTSVTLVWQGNESATEYRYKFDSVTWSDWDETTSQTFDYLDEGMHNLELQAQSINGDEQTIPTLLEFEVDAVAGPSALVYPYEQAGSPGDTLIYQIVAEDVTDLFAVECLIVLDDQLEIIETADGDLLSEWGGNPLVIMDLQPGHLNLSIASVEGTNTAFTGSSTIVSLVVRIKPDASVNAFLNALTISDVIYLQPNLERIASIEVRAGIVNVY
jgi:hypothetical protein